MRGGPKNVTVSLKALGWHIAFTCEIDPEVPAPVPEVAGINRGLPATLALLTEERVTMRECRHGSRFTNARRSACHPAFRSVTPTSATTSADTRSRESQARLFFISCE
ncbi:MAG: hypothetical protein CL858_29155 [Cupriavidus sp.]|nr:hypothetical protein [Cupriavidus sp.]